MSVRASCGCGWSAEVDDRYAGKKGKCPRCGAAVAIPMSDYEVIVDEPLIERPAVRTLPPEPKPVPTPVSFPSQPKTPVAFHQAVVPQLHRTSNTAGVVAIVFGSLALLVSWIPFVGLLAVPAGLFGVVLAIVGLAIAIFGKRQGFASPIVGGGMSMAAMVIATVASTMMANSMAESARRAQLAEAQAEAERARAQAAAPAAPVDQPPVEPAPAPVASSDNGLLPGDIVILDSPYRGRAMLAVDDAAWDDMQRAAKIGTIAEFANLIRQGKVLSVANGTEAEIVENSFSAYLVRLGGNEHNGRGGWIERDFVKRKP
jgi:hypothetical protein